MGFAHKLCRKNEEVFYINLKDENKYYFLYIREY